MSSSIGSDAFAPSLPDRISFSSTPSFGCVTFGGAGAAFPVGELGLTGGSSEESVPDVMIDLFSSAGDHKRGNDVALGQVSSARETKRRRMSLIGVSPNARLQRTPTLHDPRFNSD